MRTPKHSKVLGRSAEPPLILQNQPRNRFGTSEVERHCSSQFALDFGAKLPSKLKPCGYLASVDKLMSRADQRAPGSGSSVESFRPVKFRKAHTGELLPFVINPD